MAKNTEKSNDKGMVGIRPPTDRPPKNPTIRPPLVSLGTTEKRVLRYLYNNPNKRFNIRAYSRHSNIPRTTINDALKSLINKGLVIYPHTGIYKITDAGIKWSELVGGMVENARRGGRERGSLSSHYLTYKLKIKDRTRFMPELLDRLHPESTGENRLQNLRQHMLYFSDATILINPKQVIIKLHEMVGDDIDATLMKSLDKAITYSKELQKVEIYADEMSLDDQHFERVESHLAGFLEKIDDKYKLELGPGQVMWIDRSKGTLNDETNSEDARKRVDEVLFDAIKNTESKLSDIDKMKDVVAAIIKLRIIDLNMPQAIQSTSDRLDEYIG